MQVLFGGIILFCPDVSDFPISALLYRKTLVNKETVSVIDPHASGLPDIPFSIITVTSPVPDSLIWNFLARQS